MILADKGVEGQRDEEEAGMTQPKISTCGLVLAGGRARRFGRDKRFAEIAGRPLIDHAIARLAPQVDQVVLSTPDDIPGYEELIHIADQELGQGPLLGIAEGMAFAADEGFDWLITVPADSPFAPNDLVLRLTDLSLTAPIRFAGSGGQRHPIFGAWPTDLTAALWALIAAGERKIDRAAEALGTYAVIDWPADLALGDPFFNINTDADLQAAQDLYVASRASI